MVFGGIMRRLLLLAVMLFMGSLLFSQTDANRRYVAVKATPLKSSTGFFGQELKNLSQGEEVMLIRDDGKWAEIQAGNQKGWVSSTSLSSRRVVASGAAVTASEVALAGKGFSEETEIEYRKSGLDFSAVDSMERINVSGTDLLGFINEGRLAKGE